MKEEEKKKVTHIISKMMESEIDGLIYENPKCDFEHIWNQAIVSANEVVQTYQEDEYVGLNDEKLDEYVITDNKSSEKTPSTKLNKNEVKNGKEI